MLHFKPNTHERIERRREKRATTQPYNPQPQPIIAAFLNVFPKPSDKVWGFYFSPKRKIDQEKTAERLAQLLKTDLVLYPRGFNVYDVFMLETPVTWRDVENYTLQMLRELDDS